MFQNHQTCFLFGGNPFERVEPEEQQRRWNEHYEKQAKDENMRWHKAYIAAQFEKHRNNDK